MESYAQQSKRVIKSTFRFNKGSLSGPEKVYNPTGFVADNPSNAEWKMQFLWPFKSEFIIVYVDADYQFTIIGRTKRDYVWIMAHTPFVSDADLNRLIDIVVTEGYSRSDIQIITHNSSNHVSAVD